MKPFFEAVWANDISRKKASVYSANFPDHKFFLGDIKLVDAADLPKAKLAWASFPCQDLSLAGQIAGINGKRSGLVWRWLKLIDQMADNRPPILVAENVTGLVSADEGKHYRALHEALRSRGYQAGAMELNAIHWVPQSRPRIFVVAALKGVSLKGLDSEGPSWMHSKALQRASQNLKDWIWWKLPCPQPRSEVLADMVDFETDCDDEPKSKHNLELISARHQTRLLTELTNGFLVAPGYKRTREGRQVLELRFDGVSGCLRTPEGGSSRQVLVLKKDGHLATRLVSVREAARLMGVRDSFQIPGSFNDGYRAMGDAVAVPVVSHLAKHLLYPLARRAT
jgi:DNA (cytosine-5)-methyltransferase 1